MLFNLDFTAYREPRGIMRALHFIFAFFAFFIMLDYSGEINFYTSSDEPSFNYPFKYPFNLSYEKALSSNCTVSLNGYYSSDAMFFVGVSVLCTLIAAVFNFIYMKIFSPYRNTTCAVIDFIVTVIFAILWLSSSAAWANSLTGIKSVLWNPKLEPANCCTFDVTSVSSLNIAVVIGFLNFFLWTTDIWFLFKETVWFQPTVMPEQISGV